MDYGSSFENKKLHNKTLVYLFIKRGFDIISSFILLILMLPVFLILIILVKVEDGGNSFYIHNRIGINGKKNRYL